MEDNFVTYKFWKQVGNKAIYISECGGVITISRYGLFFPEPSMFSGPAMRAKSRPAYFRLNVKYRLGEKYVTYNFCPHRAVAEVYLHPKDLFEIEVDHLDGNIRNNHRLNLEYVTHEENIRRRWEAYYKRKGASAHTDVYTGGGSPQKGGVSQ